MAPSPSSGLAGPRVTEAAELRRTDIDLRRSTLKIADSKTPTGIRVVNLSPLLVEILARVYASVALKPDSPALPSSTGTYRDRHNLARLLDGVVAEADRERVRAGLPKLPSDVTPHTLRRTYVSLLLEARAPIPYVMQQIGHKDQKTVLEIYARVLQRQGREEVGAAFDRLLD